MPVVRSVVEREWSDAVARRRRRWRSVTYIVVVRLSYYYRRLCAARRSFEFSLSQADLYARRYLLKLKFVKKVSPEHTAAVHGRNDDYVVTTEAH